MVSVEESFGKEDVGKKHAHVCPTISLGTSWLQLANAQTFLLAPPDQSL